MALERKVLFSEEKDRALFVVVLCLSLRHFASKRLLIRISIDRDSSMSLSDLEQRVFDAAVSGKAGDISALLVGETGSAMDLNKRNPNSVRPLEIVGLYGVDKLKDVNV